MKKKILKVLALVACAVLLVVGSIAGTLAYMTSQAEVTNTFTVGNVAITMTEAKVTAYGVKDGDTRVTTNEYKLIPGHEYVKDPTIYVEAGSEECYLFVKVVNGISAIEAAGDTTIAKQLADNNWVVFDEANGIYVYKTTVDARKATENVVIPVFAKFTIASTANVTVDADTDSVADYTKATVDVTAYAIQADGFDDAADAWDAAKFN